MMLAGFSQEFFNEHNPWGDVLGDPKRRNRR
jgi:hypothetical protein